MTLTVGSLFAGIGGFDLAAERAGMSIAWQSEIDPAASRVLAHHWPAVPNYGDIHDICGGRTCDLVTGLRRRHASRHRPTVTVDDVERSSGVQRRDRCEHCRRVRVTAVDVLTGGFPCQDYSMAGFRRGLAGDRGALWWQFHRLIDESRPRWVVGENVAGLLISRDGRDFATIIDSLTARGYGVVWRVLDAQWFGVAQRRRRVFIVGHHGGIPRPEVLALGQSVSGDPQPRRTSGAFTSALTASGLADGGPDDNLGQAGHIVGALRSRDDRGPAVDTRDPGLVAFTSTRHEGHRSDGVSPPITVGSGLSIPSGPAVATDEMIVRRLTPTECERLQGFPDGWTAIAANETRRDTHRYRQLGNAVAVPVVEWIMRRIVAAEQ